MKKRKANVRKRKPESQMSSAEFCAAIGKLGLSQQRAGVFFGFSKRTGQRFALGEKAVPLAVVYLIAEMLKNKTTPADLEKQFSKK